MENTRHGAAHRAVVSGDDAALLLIHTAVTPLLRTGGRPRTDEAALMGREAELVPPVKEACVQNFLQNC